MNKQIEASHRLEELAEDLKTIIAELRDSTTLRSYAYRRVYEFRREIGYVVATLGEGRPEKYHTICGVSDINRAHR